MLEIGFKEAIKNKVIEVLDILSHGTDREYLDDVAYKRQWERKSMSSCIYYHSNTDVKTFWGNHFIFWDYYNHPRDFYGTNKFKYFSLGIFHAEDYGSFKRKLDFDVAYYEMELFFTDIFGAPFKVGEYESENIMLGYSYWKKDGWLIGIQQAYNDPQYPVFVEVVFAPESEITELPIDIKMIYKND